MPVTGADTLGEVDFIDEGHARFSFHGHFDGRQVTWHCDLYSLAQYAREHLPHQAEYELQQFLEISAADSGDEFDISIGLMLGRIDLATVWKTIIMVRNYKRLAVGRHDYGEVHRIRLS